MARTVLRTPALHRRLVHLIAKKITRECKRISSKKNSTLLRLSLNKVKSFDWKLLRKELKRHTPTLLSVLEAASCNQPSKRNPRIVGMAAAALLKGRNKNLCLLQGVVSTILYAGHSSKKVKHICMVMVMVSILSIPLSVQLALVQLAPVSNVHGACMPFAVYRHWKG